jgi:hypothetical protein
MPLAMPGKTKLLKITNATSSAFLHAAGNAGQNKVLKNKPTRRRQLLLLRIMVTSRLFTLMKQKGIFVYPV